MDVDPLPWLILALSLLFVIFAAAAEIAYAGVNRRDMREKADAGKRRAQTVETLLSDATQLLMTTMLLKTGGLFGVGAATIMLFPSTLGRFYACCRIGPDLARLGAASGAEPCQCPALSGRGCAGVGAVNEFCRNDGLAGVQPLATPWQSD